MVSGIWLTGATAYPATEGCTRTDALHPDATNSAKQSVNHIRQCDLFCRDGC